MFDKFDIFILLCIRDFALERFNIIKQLFSFLFLVFITKCNLNMYLNTQLGLNLSQYKLKRPTKKKGVQDKQNEKSFTFQTQISFF